VCAFVACRRHAEQVSALAGLQLTSIVGVQSAQLAAKAVTSSSTWSTLAGSACLLPAWRRCYGSHARSGTWFLEQPRATVKKTAAFLQFPSVFW